MPGPVCLWIGADSMDKFLTRKSFNHKVQFTVSLCVGIVLFTVILFILCTLDPSKVSEEPWRLNGRSGIIVTLPRKPWLAIHNNDDASGHNRPRLQKVVVREEAALEGMGTLFRRGRTCMTKLVVAHLSENTTTKDLRWFLRGLHRSGMPARADVVLLFPWRPIPVAMADVIHEEEQSFQRLLELQTIKLNPTSAGPSSSEEKSQDILSATSKTRSLATNSTLSIFNFGSYSRAAEEPLKGRVQSIWGCNRIKFSRNQTKDDKVAYGALVGFDMQELDPDDALRGFLNESPADLRRWICYQILLGMVQQRYRHVFLIEVRGMFILKDILTPLKKKDTGLHFFYQDQRWGDARLEDTGVSKDDEETHKVLMNENVRSKEGPLDAEVNSGQAVKVVEEWEKQSSDDGSGELEREATEDLENEDKSKGTAHHAKGMFESVFGKEMWISLDNDDKQKKVISTSVILGGSRSVRSLASAMETEIVRVSLLRRSRKSFIDDAILSYLVHKSSVLGRKVASHVQIYDNGQSSINLLLGPQRSSSSNDFFQPNGARFSVIQGLHSTGLCPERRKKVLDSIYEDICRSGGDSRVYRDCLTDQNGQAW